MKFSIKNNIVESNEWANLAIENGINGGYLGEKAIESYKKTVSDPAWKETVGKKTIEKILKTRADPVWQETVGKKLYEKMLKTRADPAWQETVGKKQYEKMSKTKSDPVWKEKNAKVCPHCNKKLDSSNYGKWHGDKCRHKPNIFIESINL